MKNKIYLLLAFFCLNIFSINANNSISSFAEPCPADDEIEISELPANVAIYVAANYPEAKVDDPEKYTVNGVITYKIELKSKDEVIKDTELVFDAQGNFLGSFVEQDVEISALPELALNNLGTAFTGIEIDDVEMEISWTGAPIFEVDLKNGVEVILDEKGNMICEDD